MIRKLLFVLYPVIIVLMAVATFIEKFRGTAFAHTHFYGSWWFTCLWALLAIMGIIYFLRRKAPWRGRPHVVALHFSFIVILLGALLTHLTAQDGTIHLRQGEPQRLSSFTLELKNFEVVHHPGTDTEADFCSEILLRDDSGPHEFTISMNHILSHRSVRLCQMSYDSDLLGTTLSWTEDPWGVPISYAGYALLFLSLLWMLVAPRGTFRRLLRDMDSRGSAVVLLLMMIPLTSKAVAPTLPREEADALCRLNILYNGRICPMETFATDLLLKVYGSRTYEGLSASQVLSGWLFYGDEWEKEPIIRLKRGSLRSTLQLPHYCSMSTFFNKSMGGYILGPYVREYFDGQRSSFHSGVIDLDERISLLVGLSHGSLLKVLPVRFQESHSRTHTEAAIGAGSTLWYAPADKPHSSIAPQQKAFLQGIFPLLEDYVRQGDLEAFSEAIDGLQRYQAREAGDALPSELQAWAEHALQAVSLTSILSGVCLLLGFVGLFVMVKNISSGRRTATVGRPYRGALLTCWLALTFLLALRWIITARPPMANGYETMLLLAWSVLLVSLLLSGRIPLLPAFGFLLAGFFLLVSHLSQMDPAMGALMPVLSSPLLSVHVSLVMMGYALCSLTFISAIIGLSVRSMARELQRLSILMLHPAVVFLAAGIFVGAIWAGRSWGVYWGWDAKETWALISLMVYAVALHRETVPGLRKPRAFHAYMLLCFLVVIMTYFGVNYFLGGMHSYA